MSFQIYSTGAPMIVSRNSVASPPVLPPEPVPTPGWISDWFELMLKKCAQGGLGPTVVTRWLFVAANMVYNSYQFVTQGKSPVDFTYWLSYDKGNVVSNETTLASWMEIACQFAFPLLIRSYMNLPLSATEVDAEIAKHAPLQQINMNSMLSLQSLISKYFAARDGDGWKNTFVFNGTLPNGDATIDASNTENQDLRNLPAPESWTPLRLNGKVKKYLTPEWGTANKGMLSEAKFRELLDAANGLFPSDDLYHNEMQEVSRITASLTVQQKMQAEYWAGGAGTITPPGMWFVMMDVVVRSNGLTILHEIRNYTIIASGLYQSSICAWRLKRDHLQARPIQMIRQFEYDQPIDQGWNDKHLGQYWLPFQELDFVTPPFPDFVSGHSTFSGTCAKLFCCLLQNDQIVLRNPSITLDILNYFSPILMNQTLNFSINSIFLHPRCSLVEQNEPPTGVILGWGTWSDMAKSCGDSRIFGGIHIQSSNMAGMYLGRLIGDAVWDNLKSI